MECRSVINSLSDYIDGRDRWLAGDEASEIEVHLDSCINCRSVRNDLAEIRTAARELPLHTPTKALWARISNTIEAELPKSQRPTRVESDESSFLKKIFSRKFSFSFPQLAGSFAAAMLLFAFGSYEAYRAGFAGKFLRQIPNAAQASMLPEEVKISAELDNKLKTINERKAGWSDTSKKSFDQDLHRIEDSLNIVRQKLLRDPNDSGHKQLLLNLYEEKRKLLENVEKITD